MAKPVASAGDRAQKLQALFTSEPPLMMRQRFRIALDRSKRAAQLVTDRAEQFSLELVCAPQCFRLSRHFTEAFLLGDIPENLDDPGNRSILAQDWVGPPMIDAALPPRGIAIHPSNEPFLP